MFGRRGFLQALLGAPAVAVTVTEITTRESLGTEIVLLRTASHVDMETAARIREWWQQAVKGTSLEHVKAIVLDGVEVELVRRSN